MISSQDQVTLSVFGGSLSDVTTTVTSPRMSDGWITITDLPLLSKLPQSLSMGRRPTDVAFTGSSYPFESVLSPFLYWSVMI